MAKFTSSSYSSLFSPSGPSLIQSRSPVIPDCIAFQHQPFRYCDTAPGMQRFRKRTCSLLLKDDSSTTELLPVQAESGSYDATPLKECQDTVEEQLPKGKLVIKGWPGPASSLGYRGWERAGLLALDSAIALIPLLFIGKSGSVQGTRT